MLNVVLVEPEIPANTGNIGRTCVLTGTRLHLVGPCGFELDDASIKRAGLAYWQSLDLRTYPSWDRFVELHPAVQAALQTSASDETASGPTLHLLTKSGARTHADSTYHQGDWLVFGKESAGLDADLLASHPELCERIPMLGDSTLSNASSWHQRFDDRHPQLERDICGNYIDSRAGQITSLNLSNAVAIVLFEALRQLGFAF